MPHHQHRKKRLRQSLERRTRNRATVNDLRTQIKKVRLAVEKGDKTLADQELRLAFKKLDKCGTRGYIHRNAAFRSKSRLAKLVNKIGDKPAQPPANA